MHYHPLHELDIFYRSWRQFGSGRGGKLLCGLARCTRLHDNRCLARRARLSKNRERKGAKHRADQQRPASRSDLPDQPNERFDQPCIHIHVPISTYISTVIRGSVGGSRRRARQFCGLQVRCYRPKKVWSIGGANDEVIEKWSARARLWEYGKAASWLSGRVVFATTLNAAAGQAGFRITTRQADRRKCEPIHSDPPAMANSLEVKGLEIPSQTVSDFLFGSAFLRLFLGNRSLAGLWCSRPKDSFSAHRADH